MAWKHRQGAIDALPSIRGYESQNGVGSDESINAFNDYLNNADSIDTDQAMNLFLAALGQANREVDYSRSLANQQRERDWQLQDREHMEQYNDPSQVLARLMATGMSRQAAMALLSGGESAMPAVGSAAGSAATSPNGSSGSAAASTAQMQAVMSGAATFSDLALQIAQFGLSAPAIMSQNSLASTADYMASMQRSAYDMSGQFYAGIHQAVLNGSLDKSQFKSYDDMARLAFALPDSPENHALYNFMHNGGYARLLANPFAMDNQHSLFNANWGTQDVATSVVDNARLRALKAQAMDIDIKAVTASIAHMNADTDLLIQELGFNAQMQPLEKRALELDIEGSGLANAYTRGELEQQWVESEEMWMDLDIAREVFDNVKDSAIYRAVGECQRLAQMADPNVVEKEMKAYIMEQDNAYAMSYLSFLTFNASAEFYDKHPDMRTILNVCDDIHLPDMLGKGTDLLGMLYLGRGKGVGSLGKGGTITGVPAENMARRSYRANRNRHNSVARDIRMREGTFYEH